ncbi:MAG: translation initiation factor IF-2 [Bacteroidetes bacterium]|nr:translation initiation factor IF-2 [Bacteroidota bacterium]
MSEGPVNVRLSKAATEFNVGVQTIIDFLHKKGHKIDSNPNTKLTPEMYTLLIKEYQPDKAAKEISKKIELEYTQHPVVSTGTRKPTGSEEKEEHDSEELIIKSSFDYQNKAKSSKTADPPKPTETAKPVIPSVATTPVSTTPVSSTPVAPPPNPEIIEQVTPVVPPVVEEVPVEKIPESQPQASLPEINQEPKIEEVKSEELPQEAPESPSTGVKVVGKIDLAALESKPKEKGKKEKSEKTEHKKEKEIPAPVEEVKEETATIAEIAEVVVVEPIASADITESPEVIVEQSKDADVRQEATSMSGVYTKEDPNFITTKIPRLEGIKLVNKIDLPGPSRPESRKPIASSTDENGKSNKKKKRKRIKTKASPTESSEQTTNTSSENKTARPPARKVIQRGARSTEPKVELTEEEIQKQIRETLQRLSGTGKSKASKYRREKRQAVSQQLEEHQARLAEEQKVLKVTEFVTANDLASMMDVAVTQIIATCMSVGIFVSINQRLDAETISLLAEEFGYTVEFVSVDVQEAIDQEEEIDKPEDLKPRTPIVTVMGHVDHGKTSLLDYIRHANVIAGEAGGITQHIGAYEVQLEDGRKLTFLDTPGHEAFTAMRARGAQITDIVIIVVAADDTVMPQTIEAINHAQAAGVPMVFAINKMDKPGANAEKIKEELSKLNILVEDWGGKYQSQEISAKKGTNINLLLDKVLLEAEMLELKANPDRRAFGTVIESSLDKGRGYVAKLLVQSGTLKIGNILLAGSLYGKVKAMYNERNVAIKEAGPSAPVLLLGLTGAPQAGDKWNVMSDEREAKQIASKRLQLQREQGIRTQKHITLDEIGRRIAIGDFKELNIIVKGDVDGSVEALSDSLLRLSTAQVQVNVIHKSVGAITESDVLLASASNAIIVGFQVRPSMSARKLAEREEIDVRLYSIIYTAINEIKAAIEGMLAPEIEEKITCNVEVRDVFRITKVGTVAGCMVLDGKINRNSRVRVIRDGIVVYTGLLGSLKRFKDDAKEVATGYECGLNIDNFNDIKIGDIIEGYEETEVKRKL